MSEKPSPHFEVLGRELFMSFGLLNEQVRLVGDLNRVAAVGLDPDLSLTMLVSLFAPRDAKGRISDPDYSLPEELSPEQAEEILDWARAHVLDFFIRRLQKTLALVDQNKGRLQAIGSSLAGSANEASKTL